MYFCHRSFSMLWEYSTCIVFIKSQQVQMPFWRNRSQAVFRRFLLSLTLSSCVFTWYAPQQPSIKPYGNVALVLGNCSSGNRRLLAIVNRTMFLLDLFFGCFRLCSIPCSLLIKFWRTWILTTSVLPSFHWSFTSHGTENIPNQHCWYGTIWTATYNGSYRTDM